MKQMMIAAAVAFMASQAFAGTVVKEGPHGTSVTTRSVLDGVLTTTETWTGKNGGVYERNTVCRNSTCSTGWTLQDRKGRLSSGERDTIFGDGKSTTKATSRRFDGKTRTRVFDRTRTVTR